MSQTAAMPKLTDLKISGAALRRLRFELAMTQGEFGKTVGLSEARVRQIEGVEETGVYPKVLRALAKLMNITPEEALKRLYPKSVQSLGEPMDVNVEPYSKLEVPEIPMFEMPIAAGYMTEVPDSHELCDPRLLKSLRFRVKIRGASMEKEYMDGSIVEFKCLQWHADGTADKMEIGKDYYVQSQDMATFKRLAQIKDDELVFVAVNKRKFPDKIKLLRENVTQMAKAVGIFTPKG